MGDQPIALGRRAVAERLPTHAVRDDGKLAPVEHAHGMAAFRQRGGEPNHGFLTAPERVACRAVAVIGNGVVKERYQHRRFIRSHPPYCQGPRPPCMALL